MPTPESSERVCDECGTGLNEDLVAGLCPRCLLGPGLLASAAEPHRDSSIAETVDPSSADGGLSWSTTSGSGGVGQSIGDYELINEIARGGMGVVYRARHRTLGREVALKLILSGQFASASDVRRFHLEAESAAALDHGGIVPIYEIGEQDGHHYFTMKLIEGGSLADQMPAFRTQVRDFVRLFAAVAEAIDYAHRRGILHRDIKPANILLDREGDPLVTDLGLAKRIQADSDLTGTGAIVGTPAYMSPEQANASKEITTATDIYSLGAILYEALTGRPPHQADSAVATLLEAARGEVTPPSTHQRSVDPVLELICLKCLAHDPEQRYASAGLLAEDCRRWLVGESVSVRPRSFTAIFGDLVANQFRSVIGAMLMGVFGGFACGVPAYAGLARRWFGPGGSRFDVQKINEQLPSTAIADSWWLHPPSLISGPGMLLGLVVATCLGWSIRALVRPQDVRQAIAIGLVAGLLMTIVLFGFYGVAAGWNSFAIQHADELNTLSRIGLADGADRQNALETLHQTYPDLASLPADQQADVVSRHLSARIMLGTLPAFLGILHVCLIFSLLYCVASTYHAHRLFVAGFSRVNRLLRYFEVMFLLLGINFMAVFGVFAAFGMLGEGHVAKGLGFVVPFLLLILATLPGFGHARWYYRWPVYIACVWLSIGVNFGG